MVSISTLRRAANNRVAPLSAALALTLMSGLAGSTTPTLADGPGLLAHQTEASTQLLASPAAVGTTRYIVQLREAPLASYQGEIPGYAPPERVIAGATTGKINLRSASATAYVGYLESRQQSFVNSVGSSFGRGVVEIARMQHALNAVILELTSAEAAALQERPDVLMVEAERQEQLHTDNAPTFTGAPAIWDGITHSGAATRGEGIVVGIVDTGVNWQSPAFAAVGPLDGYVHVNPRGTGNYLGTCATGGVDAGRCNDKLIGMYNFATAGASGQDTQGHGSHTASTVAGNRWAATFGSGPFTVSGVAPRANVITYLACPSTCPTTATTQSVNQAVVDGVDVLNYSISGGTSPWTDTTSTAFRNANAAGMFVAASAGNTSTTTPNPQGQVNHIEPWVETVAASTQNRLIGVNFDLDGGPVNTQNVPMRMGAPPFPTAPLISRPVIKSPTFADGANDACAAFPAGTFTGPYVAPAENIFANGFDEPTPPPTTVGGIAVLRLDGTTSACGSGVRRTNAVNAGAAGVIFVDTAYLNLGAADTSWSMLLSDWNLIEAAMVPGTSTGSIDIVASTYPATGDLVAGFSFRGPRLIGGQGLVKPDITAPGVDILAVGAANVVGASGVYLNNGTSMSSPHIAGAAALLRALNPSWTAPQIKSALNLSSNNFGAANQDGSPIRAWDYGSGRVNLAAAAKVGLIMDETAANFLAANPTTGGDIATLNLASLAKYNFTGTYTFTRTFRRAKAGSQNYTLSVVGLPAGSVTVTPASFSINASGTRTVTVAVNSALLPEAAWTLGELLVTPAGGDEPNLKLPIAVYPGGPQIAVTPSSLSGSSDTTVSNNLTISNTANPTLNWQFQTTGTAVSTPFNTTNTTSGQQGGYYAGTSRGYYWAQNFDVSAAMRVTTLRANGFTLPSTTALAAANTSAITFSVYADVPPNPAGAGVSPETFGAAPLWTFSGAISTANGITTTGGTLALNLNATNVVGTPLNLAPGRYWLAVTPRLTGTGAQTAANPLWAWYTSGDVQVGNIPKLWAPWSDPTQYTTSATANMLSGFVQGQVNCAAPAWVSLTTTSGALGAGNSQVVPVTFNAAGLSAGTYTGDLCITSNATNAPVVTIPLSFNVPNGGAQAPTVSKAFAPTSFSAGGTSTLTITLNNAGPTASTLTAPLVDTFPSGLVVAAAPNAATTCPSGTVTAVAAAGSVTLGTGAQIPATGSCTVTVDVTASTPNTYTNTIAAGALQTSSGNNAAAASANVGVTVVTWTVTPSVGTGTGTITPSTPQTVNNGATTSFTLTPGVGEQIGTVGGTCGGSLSGSNFTTAAVTASCTVIANFIPPQCAPGNTVEVTATGGTTGPTNYTTLKGAFDAINAGTHTGTLDVAICADTTEAASAVLNASGSGSASYTVATIKPAGGAARTVSGSLAAPLVDLNGADNVTIDGVNAGGNALTLSNASTAATAGTSTIRFIEGATGNTVTRTTILGSSTAAVAAAAGNVLFSTSTVAGGNSTNTVSDNNIGPAGANLPSKAVTLLGSATPNHNTGNTITGNRIFDFFLASGATAGISVQTNNDTTTISNNRLYQTATRTFTGAAGVRYSGILVNSATYTTNVTGNIIGFGAADGTGTTTITGTGTGLQNEIRGVVVTNAKQTAPYSTVSNNTISGFNQTTARASTTAELASFIGIHSGSSADAPANITGNTVGSLDGSTTIVVNAGSTTANTAAVTGILNYNFVGGISVANNNIGAITINNAGTGTGTGFRGVYVLSTTGVLHSVTDNVIGGPTAAGGIVNNIVGSNSAFGIQVTSASGTVTGNTVRNISGNANNAAVVMSGIFMSGSTAVNATTVARNTVHSLRNSSSTGAVGASYAIDLALPGNAGNLVERNLVHSIWTDSTFADYQIIGLILRGTTPSTTTVRNNMIRLGFDANGVAMPTAYILIGIRDSAGTSVANQYYHNSVYLGGSGLTGGAAATVRSYALNSDTVTTARNFQNNIFWNARGNATAGGPFHVAVRFGGTTVNPPGLISNYNDLLATGTDGMIGLFNGFVYPTLATWNAATGQDANSFSADPQFIAPTGDAVTGNLHIHPTNPTPIEGTGTLVASVTDDFDGDDRSANTPVDVGADAGNFVALPQFTVTPSVSGANGTISPATVQTVFSGGTASFTLTADSGYQIGAVTGTCGGTLSGSVYTTNAVTANCTVIASFTSTGWTVTPSVSGSGGAISPNTPQTVANNGTTTFTLTPDAGHHIVGVAGSCGGTLTGNSYTTAAIVANCTVIASFAINTYTVTPSSGSNGTISPNTAQTVNHGATTTFTLTPDVGYHVDSVGGTCPAGTLTGNSYVTGAIVGDCTVIANFAINTYTVTPSVSGGNGTISPATAQTVNHGATTTFTLTPDDDHSIGTVGGTCGGTLSGNSYTTSAVTAGCTVIASFPSLQCTTASPVEVKSTAGTTARTGYASLGAAFTAINAGTHQGSLKIELCGDTTEAASAVLNASGAGSALYTDASVKPVGGAARTVTGSLAAPLVDFNGADNVTIDGVNTGGNALTISNTSTASTTTTSTIRFIGGATGNTITRSTILGSSTTALTTNGGTIFFSTDTVAATGNDNNTISNNNIGPAGTNLPTKAIYGNGSQTATTSNSNVSISNNNIYDFFSATTSISGIYVNSGNTDWTISNNRIYQTAARTFTSTGLRYAGITATTPSGTTGWFTITGNRIGFGAADGSGTTTISGSTNTFRGVDTATLSSATATTIDNNIVSGISQTSASTGTSTAAPFIALMLGSSEGLINASGNKIGSLDGSTTISLTLNGASGGSSLGIYNFTSFNTTVANNEIGAISIQGTGTTAGFTGIYAWTVVAATATFTNNVVGGPTAAGGISSTHTSNAGLFGLRTNTPNAIITGNTVRNLSGVSVVASSIIGTGIFVVTTSTNPSTISGNTVHSITNNAGTANNSIYAVYTSFGTAANVVERNSVHSLVNTSTNQSAQIAGVLAVAGSGTYANNMVRLGHDPAGAVLTGGNVQYGIFEIAGVNSFYHNSVYLGGSNAASTTSTFAFVSNVTTGTRNYQNNIFWNAASTASGTGKNYAIAIGGTVVNPAGVTSSNNDLYATGTGGLVGRYNAVDQTTLTDWQTATGVDAGSFSSNPQFIAPAGSASSGDLHISPSTPTPIEGTGIAIPAVTVDFDNETRSGLTPTDVGADAGNFTFGP